MGMKSFAIGSYKFCEWVTKLVYLNLLWFTFTIVGLVIFGLMPATVAMFGVVRKWILENKDIEITALFWKTYKEQFVKANGLGMILIALGYLFMTEIKILQASSVDIFRFASIGVVVIFVMYLVVVMYFFPIFVHFNLRNFDYF